MWHLLNYRGMNGNATIMLRAGEVLLKSFKTASLPTFGCLLCFVLFEIVSVVATGSSESQPGAAGKMIEFGDDCLESEAFDFP